MSGFLRTTLLISWKLRWPIKLYLRTPEPVMIKYDEQNCLLPADTSCIDISSVPRSCDDEGSPPGRRPWRSSVNDKLIPGPEFWELYERVLAHLGCIDGLRHDQHPRTRGGRGEGGREVRVRGWRGRAGGLWPLGCVMRVEAGHDLLLLQATSFSPWNGRQSISWSWVKHAAWWIYIKLPRLYTITWSREGYLFCQCHRNVNWRALIKNKSWDKLYNGQLETTWLRERWDIPDTDKRPTRPILI